LARERKFKPGEPWGEMVTPKIPGAPARKNLWEKFPKGFPGDREDSIGETGISPLRRFHTLGRGAGKLFRKTGGLETPGEIFPTRGSFSNRGGELLPPKREP